MKTSKEDAQKILIKIQKVTEARIRPMMGEYLVYADEKLIGQLSAARLFVKVTDFGEAFASELEKQSAYDGAKPAFVVPQEKLDDTAWLHEFIKGTVKELPDPKKKA